MVARTIAFRRYSPPLTRRGFTLVEVLVSIFVLGVVLALITPLLVSARNMVDADQLRTATNQGVRAASDIIGTDIRMAGERFPLSSSLPLPPIEIIPGGANPDDINLRRNLWEATFPICEDVATANTTVRVVQPDTWAQSATYPECLQPVNGAGWPVNLADVRNLANTIGQAGVLRGYIFDPPNNRGEFFDLRVEDNADATHRITKVSGNFQFPYALVNRPRIYILEERHYRISASTLELLINEGAPLRVAAGLINLRTQYVMSDGTVTTAIPVGMTWRDIRSVELTVTSRTTEGPNQVDRSLTTRYFPRNVLSR